MSIGIRGAAVLATCAALLGFPDAAESVSISFQQVTTALFEHSSGASKFKHLPETMGSGVGLLDIDQDGRLDIFFVNGAGKRHRLLRNLGSLRFRDVTTLWGIDTDSWGMGVAVGDYNNDGLPDLYVTGVGRNRLYRNTGSRLIDATATAGVPASGWSAGAAFFDYDRDGKLDLFVARYLDWDIGSSKWCGEGDGAPRSYCHPREYTKVSHILFRNRGDGTFEDVSRRTGIQQKPGKGLGVKIEDLNGDQWPDILVANDSVPQQLFLNLQGKSFDESAVRSGIAYDENGNTYAGMGIDAADVDGDGTPDVVINALARQGYWLYKNDKTGSFSLASSTSGLLSLSEMHSGWGMRLADLDNDGPHDLVVAQGHVMDTIEWSDPSARYREPPMIAKNIFGKFFDVSMLAGPAFRRPRAGRGLATGDLDGDGRLDIVINNNNSPPTILRNTTASGANWIDVRLEGTKSNRDGYGSVVLITTESGVESRAYSDSSGSYLSASSPTLHFGLGSERAIRVDVRWPSGSRSVQELRTLNRIVRVRE